MKKIIKVLHLVPTSYGGGVETAAKSFLEFSCKKFIFKVIFLKNKKTENSFFKYLITIRKIFKEDPDIILSSLWKSNFVTLFYKLFNPKIRYILFLHNTNNLHFVDKFITSLTAFLAFEIWADASHTMEERLKSLFFFKFKKRYFMNKNKKRVISFVTEKLVPINRSTCKTSFIYWGRLSPQKNIHKAIKIFSKIYEYEKSSIFRIIGPDYGVKKNLYSKIIKLGLEKNILIYDYMSFEEIKKFANSACFFIQLSSYEGFAMSVSEAMRLGLIPVVTSVGQIKYYCKNLQNSLIYDENDKELITNIFSLTSSSKKYLKIRKNAISTWKSSNTYKNEIISALEKII